MVSRRLLDKINELSIEWILFEVHSTYRARVTVPNVLDGRELMTYAMWIFPKTLCLPVLASFTDSKLLDLSQASDSMTLCIDRTLCVAHYSIR